MCRIGRFVAKDRMALRGDDSPAQCFIAITERQHRLDQAKALHDAQPLVRDCRLRDREGRQRLAQAMI